MTKPGLYSVYVSALLCMGATLSQASDNWRMVGVVFDKGEPTAQIADALEGDESVMYRFVADEGQVLSVTLQPQDEPADFIVYAPGKWPGDVLHDSAASGEREYRGRVDRDGHWAVLVYRDLSGGTPTEPTGYDLELTLE